MATSLKNLSTHSDITVDISKKKFGIVVAEWNSEITESRFYGGVGDHI
jgi:6,7-dimethyl-8-ribityllumazine synthase